jgi:hypothetical protein
MELAKRIHRETIYQIIIYLVARTYLLIYGVLDMESGLLRGDQDGAGQFLGGGGHFTWMIQCIKGRRS